MPPARLPSFGTEPSVSPLLTVFGTLILGGLGGDVGWALHTVDVASQVNMWSFLLGLTEPP